MNDSDIYEYYTLEKDISFTIYMCDFRKEKISGEITLALIANQRQQGVSEVFKVSVSCVIMFCLVNKYVDVRLGNDCCTSSSR